MRTLRDIEDMVSLRPRRIGVANTLFIAGCSPLNRKWRDAPQITIAVDPPDAIAAPVKTVAMTIEGCEVFYGTLAPHVVAQTRDFIERNRDTLLAYWDAQIDTEQLIERLK